MEIDGLMESDDVVGMDAAIIMNPKSGENQVI